MSQIATVYLIDVTSAAESGVDYSSRYGAKCPACGKRAKVVTTRPWEDTVRVRYHQCQTVGCVLASQGKMIKSVEADSR